MVLNCAIVKQHKDTMNKADKNKSSGHFKIHNVGFYHPAPRQIKCLSYNRRTSKLAVSRDDASIEIWDMQSAVYMEKCILGDPSWSVEALGWLNNRLFSTGLTGELIEWNSKTLKPTPKATLTGNGAGCMDIHNANGCIAIGTNEGYLNTFSVEGDDINPSKPFDQQQGPILCCKYDSTGRFIVTGSTDIIRVWDVTNGQPIYKMSPGRAEKNREINVWSLVVLKDLTIIAGDSRGFITVWNGKNGTHIDSISNALDADVLTVAVNDEENMFCCSGVDPKIKIYAAIEKQDGAPRKWLRNFKRSVHDHDVKALAFVDEKKIISGGVNGYINVSCTTKELSFNQTQYGPFLPEPCAVVAVEARLLLLKYFNYFEVWELGTPNEIIQLSEEDGNQKKFLFMDKNQKSVVQLKNKNGKPITCASISPNGKFLIFSTESKLKLFQLDTQIQTASLAKVKVTSDKFTACAKVLFSSDSKYLFCVKDSGDIEIFSLSYNDDVDFKATVSTEGVIKDTIRLIYLSKCGKYLVCVGTCGTTAVWTNKGNRWSYLKQISKQNCVPTAIAMHSKTNRIVLAFADYKIFEYDLTTDTIVCASDAFLKDKLTRSLKNSTDKAINNILLDENNENVVILQNDSFLFVLEKTKAPTLAKKLKSDQSKDLTSAEHYKLITHMGNYEHFVHMAWLSPSEIVAVVVNPVTLIEQLPPSMVHKLFGVS
ncbi:U3 small nucleolar RNA-associated protein 4 homolog [Bradysia coprophila]|uniref:U3 small nucleolar RNA-associated protein 4 homolog n=1 Tax=Bradysia coprophila TaxID=38358 RepID=UPI00187DCFFA|nr:U3 small nucleolar RNA-associated protein 4 homolog [Bradysia coprophila]